MTVIISSKQILINLVQSKSKQRWKKYRFLKRAIDITISLLALSTLWPIFVLIAASITLTSKGVVIFKHQRVGKDGKLFTLYKFRTMSADTPKYAPKPREDDPRVNRFGRFLRKSGLDELPQLLNVLKGDMSLIGPRPEMEFIVEDYTIAENERLKVKPGITGLWQLSSKVKEPIHHNLDYDLSYIRNQTLPLDFKILFKTLIISFEMLKSALEDSFIER